MVTVRSCQAIIKAKGKGNKVVTVLSAHIACSAVVQISVETGH